MGSCECSFPFFAVFIDAYRNRLILDKLFTSRRGRRQAPCVKLFRWPVLEGEAPPEAMTVSDFYESRAKISSSQGGLTVRLVQGR